MQRITTLPQSEQKQNHTRPWLSAEALYPDECIRVLSYRYRASDTAGRAGFPPMLTWPGHGTIVRLFSGRLKSPYSATTIFISVFSHEDLHPPSA